MVSSANGFRDDMVYLKVLCLEMLTASVAVASLFSIQQRLVFSPRSVIHLLQWKGGRERRWLPSRSNATRN